MRRLAIVVSHPIQYYAPVFQALARHQDKVAVKVFYTWGGGALKKYDPGFQREIQWDIPLLEGYDYVFLKNTAEKPGTNHFNGIINPDAIAVISEFDPHAVLVYGWSWKSHFRLIRFFHKRNKLWFRGDSNLLDEIKGWRNLARFVFLRWLYSHIDLAFFVGTANEQYFRKFGLKSRQLKFAPHAIDNRRFSQDRTEEAAALRKELGIPEKALLVLFAGKLEPKKDPIGLLDAFLRLSNDHAYLLFAGNGVLEHQVKELAKASPKRDKIRFIDFQNQGSMPVLYQACQLFCLPSKGPGETWGLAVNEAMASGRAVLVSDKVGCAIDLVREGENGSVFKAGNRQELLEKMQHLLQDEHQLSEMGKRSGEAIRRWSFDQQATSILEEVVKIQTI